MTELFERIPINRLKLINKMSLEDYINIANKKKYKLNEIKEHFKLIKSYIKDHLKCGGEMKKLYKYTETSKNGRLYGINSIQNLDSIIRGFLFSENTTDLDMNNAHPRILEYICRVRNINCPHLSQYVSQRERILSKLKMVGVDNPKMEILKMLNTEKTLRINNDCENILKHLRDEFKTIRVELKKQVDFVEQLQEAMIYKPNNVEGSFVNRILCIYENKILQSMVTFIHLNNMEIAEYAFDGCLIYGNLYENEIFLKDITDYINNQFPDLNMVLTYKKHSEVISYEFLDNLEEVAELDETETYEYMKEEFEKNHFKIINKSFFIKEYNDKYIFMKKQNIIDAYEHLHFKELNDKGEIITKQFISYWLKDTNIKYYTDIDTFPPPLICPNDIYNLWRGFAMEKVVDYEQKDISLFLNHIKIMCNNEEEIYDYFIKWLGQMVQYPSVKTTMILIQGEEGCGKGFLFKIIENMIGSNMYLETTSPERDVWGVFNGLMANSFFIYLNELSKKQNIEAEHKIKALITDHKLQINIKGKDSIDTNSFHRFCSSTNDEDPIRTHKGDRRKLLINASSELKGNYEYFVELNKCLEDVNYIKSFFEYLKSIPDLDNFNSIKIPMTEYQERLCELSISPIELFIKDMIQNTEETQEIIMTSKELFDNFREYLQLTNNKFDINMIKFGVRLYNLKINGIDTKHTKKGNMKVFNVPILKKHYNIGCLID